MNAGLGNPSPVAIVGQACRLPGARDVDAFWSLLASGRCAVSEIPDGRWLKEKLFHPVAGTPGCAYTFAAGVLDNLWDFDAAAFRLSPREAVQMDPQQRILLELVVEALDRATLPAANLRGQKVGVFVGASSLDYGTFNLFDPSVGDQYFATGNTLSLIANRISYCFDFHGPSYTVDTACSSSLVALNEAIAAIRDERIDTAIVAGVNALLSPVGFISFSQAKMLSPTGLCHAFDADADGYVRAEGAVVLVLRALERARSAGNPVRALIRAAGVNSDGQTVGVSLPSAASQAALLRQVYAEANLDPMRLAFVEAHGTGTAIGDPVEAAALGEALARRRRTPLPIGSAKTNIGHTEPVSGLVGVLKASLALEKGFLPPSLHFTRPNPNIPFGDLRLAVAANPIELASEESAIAGVSSFGFGGTNAHVVLSGPPRQSPRAKRAPAVAPAADQLLIFGARTSDALPAVAARLAECLESAGASETAPLLAAIANRHRRLPARGAVIAANPAEMAKSLRAIAAGASAANTVRGLADREPSPTAFVYSGNGSQWAGMGRQAFAASTKFRAHFLEIDDVFSSLSGWSLRAAMFADDVGEQLASTMIAQPLLFAMQAATTRTLADLALRPAIALGHSVGEIAAAYACGYLTLHSALRVVIARSRHQEAARGLGRMGVLFADEAHCRRLAVLADVDIAAVNGPHAFTLAGRSDAIETLAVLANRDGMKFHRLDLDYPFHSRLLEDIRKPLLAELADLDLSEGDIRFVSTVTGDILGGGELDARYWWRNIREPVLFSSAVRTAFTLGARHFVEIGPKPTLLRHISDTLASQGERTSQSYVLDVGQSCDPFQRGVAAAWVAGAELEIAGLIGGDPGSSIVLPSYPWQRKTYRLDAASQAPKGFAPGPWHNLLGAEFIAGSGEWHCRTDVRRIPQLGEHRVDGRVVMPGAAFVDMMWSAAAREGIARIGEVDLVAPLVFDGDSARDLRTTVSTQTGVVEIASRPAHTDADWMVHARGKIFSPSQHPSLATAPAHVAHTLPAADLYAMAARSGLDFGPSFRRLKSIAICGPARLVAELDDGGELSSRHVLEPWRLDSAFHALIALFGADGVADPRPYVPIRFSDAQLFKKMGRPKTVLVDVARFDERAIEASFELIDAQGELIAKLAGVRFQQMSEDRDGVSIDMWRESWIPLDAPASVEGHLPADGFADVLQKVLGAQGDGRADELILLLDGWALAFAARCAETLRHEAAGDAQHSSWRRSLVMALEDFGLLAAESGEIVESEIADIPAPEKVLEELARNFPEAAAELVLANHLTTQGAGTLDAEFSTRAAALADTMMRHGVRARDAARQMEELLRHAKNVGAAPRDGRLLLLGHSAATGRIARFCAKADLRFAICETDARQFERARVLLEGKPAELFARADEIDEAAFDVIIGGDSLYRLGRRPSSLDLVARALKPGGRIMLVASPPSLFLDVTAGLQSGWFDEDDPLPAGPLFDAGGWSDRAARAGLTDISADRIGSGTGPLLLFTARAPSRQTKEIASERKSATIVCLGSGLAKISAELSKACGRHGIEVGLRTIGASQAPVLKPSYILLDRAAGEINAARLLALRDAIDSAPAATVWHVLIGDRENQEARAMADSLQAFLRTTTNERPDLDLRCVTFEQPDVAGFDRFAALAAGDTNEREIRISSTRALALRNLPCELHGSVSEAEALRLEKRAGRGFVRLSWAACERAAPGRQEVEIEVAATGLNFRDVMWTLGFLTDEILEAGFAGPSLGLEVSGTISRIGSGVSSFAVGDRVMGFARHGYADRTIVPVSGVRKIPDSLPLEAAATVPVAFATAWYGLVTLAKLRRGEWVLVHGGAGGVGLAAIQIAAARGARVVATAGSAEKRDFLRLMGVEHVLNSRTLDFADEVRTLTGGGVDVVLNSLAGEAMERSIACLRAFGRFIELGKRDFVANTHIGLQKFRPNLSYHAVDLDQLARVRPAVLQRVFGQLEPLFAKGALRPLPYRIFEAFEAADAFRLMQQAGHVGKIVVRAPDAHMEAAPQQGKRFAASAARTHLVTGGASGFGLQTALWLAAQGARSIVLAGRRAEPSAEAGRLAAELAERGVTMRYRRCDVSRIGDLRMLLADIETSMPPLGGVVHAAMTLEDQMLSNLTPDAVAAVLAPKIDGARNLDELTRSLPLDYFVLFSSATTMIGNPGQAAYVTANAYMEGLARARCAPGLPALAVAWGALSDVGALVERPQVREMLERAGVKPFPAAAALERLGRLLAAQQAGVLTDAVVTVAALDWRAARRRLPLLKAPAFAVLTRLQADGDETTDIRTDLAAIAAAEGAEAANAAAQRALIEIAASILRIPIADIDSQRRLSDVGFDSLMGAELALAIEQRLGLNVQAVGFASDITLAKLAVRLVTAATAANERATPLTELPAVNALMKKHLVTAEDIVALTSGLADGAFGDLIGKTG